MSVESMTVCAGKECRGYSRQHVQEKSAEGMVAGSMCRNGVQRV